MSSHLQTDTFFSVMRLFLPQVDKARPAYGMKQTVLAKYYIEILNISKDSVDGKKLLNYRVPTSAKQVGGGGREGRVREGGKVGRMRERGMKGGLE